MSDTVDTANDLVLERIDARVRAITQPRPVATEPDCIECGTRIPAKRRQALPWATTCVECQGYLEQKGVRHG